MGWPLALALLVGGLLLGQLWARRTRPLWRFGSARPGLAFGAIAAVAAALVLGVRGAWPEALAALLIAAGLAAVARGRMIGGGRKADPPHPPLSVSAAAALLGVEPDASPEAVRAAHRRLIAFAHPDRGGTEGLAAQLNAARDVLLNRPSRGG